MTPRDLIIFADDWGRYPSTTQYLGRILAERHRIVWVGSLGLRKPRVHLADLSRVLEKMRGMFRRRPVPTSAPVFEVHPLVLPFHDVSAIRSFNLSSVEKSVRQAVQDHGLVDPIVISSSPLTGPLVGRLGESSFHYLCLDDFSKFEGAFECLLPLERQLVSGADSVFAVSDVLRAVRFPPSGRSYFLPQGVDADHFRRHGGELPAPLQHLPRPLIGFFGILAPWIDQELLVRAAQAHPEASVVLLGRSSSDLSALQKVPNIHYFGEIPYIELPRWGQWFDVGLIPFIRNELTIAANPLKLLEYLSLGLPVVSTDLPEVRKFQEVVHVETSNEGFVAAIGQALRENRDVERERRRKIAERFSWRSIVHDMMEKVLAADAAKRSGKAGGVTA